MWIRSRNFLSYFSHRLKLLNKSYVCNFTSNMQTVKQGSSYNFFHILCKQNSDKLCSVLDFHNVLIRSYCKSDASSSEANKSDDDIIKVYFVHPTGEEVEVLAKVGDNVMELGLEFVDTEGACNGQMACSTCHVYVDDRFEKYFDEPTEEEDDIIDSAPFRKMNSRLSCCLTITKEMDGIKFGLPKATINFYVDGKKPLKH